MATSVVEACHKAGKDSDTTLGTVLVALLLTTFLVGVLIILTGKMQMYAVGKLATNMHAMWCVIL